MKQNRLPDRSRLASLAGGADAEKSRRRDFSNGKGALLNAIDLHLLLDANVKARVVARRLH
jgi:hypothetical protein